MLSSPPCSDEEPFELLEERRELVRVREGIRDSADAWIRHQVLVNGRIDVLAREVFRLDVEPHHLAIMQHQSRYRDRRGCLVLCGRGFGKSIAGTQLRIVFEILRNPDIRIIVASRSADNAQTLANWARQQFESHEDLRRIFGDFVGKTLWDKRRWTIAKRTQILTDPTVQVLGQDSATASKHCDVLFCDDLVDNKNSWTPGQRTKTHEFFYKVLLPTVLADGIVYTLGTRYHGQDLYAHWMDPKAGGEMCGDRALVMPVLVAPDDGDTIDEDDAPVPERRRSIWEKMHSTEELLRLEKAMGRVLFSSQYLMDVSLMKGAIFDWDWFHWLDPDDPDDAKRIEASSRLPHYQGTDLAIAQTERNDFFADAIIAVDRNKKDVYVRDVFEDRIPFHEQKSTVISRHRRFHCLRGVMETVAYQKALLDEVKREEPDIRITKKPSGPDKVARAHTLTGAFTDGRVFVIVGRHERFVDQMVLFPDVEHDDSFDAFDFAYTASKIRVIKEREEPGVI